VNIFVVNWKDPSGPAAGGSEVYVAHVTEVWAAQGHSVTLFVPQQSGRPATENLAGVTYVRAGNIHSVFPYSRLYLERHGHKFDVVLESVSVRPFLTHYVVGDRATALVYHVAREQWDHEMRFPLNWMGRRLLEPGWLRRLVTGRVAALSPSTAADLELQGIKPVAIVPPGCATRPRMVRRQLASSPRLVFMGRLVQYKKPADAIHAFERVRSEFPGATLDVIGGGYLLDKLRKWNTPGVRVHGFLPESEKQELLAQADLALLPGTREGWGIVAMEAAAHGAPVVAYDIAGLRDAVADGRTGLLTASTPEAMAGAALDILRSPERWGAMSYAAQVLASDYTWERCADALLAACTSGTTVDVAGRRVDAPDVAGVA